MFEKNIQIRSCPAAWHRHRFSLVEMLIVVVIMLVLVSMLLPALEESKEIAYEAQCATQQRAIMTGAGAFALDQDRKLPGCFKGVWEGSEPEQKSWMGTEVWSAAGQPGTLLPYIGGVESARLLYRCPALQQGNWNSGIGSNGSFDYSSFLVFSGAKISLMPVMTTLSWEGTTEDVMTPFIIEEDPYYYLNRGNIEPGHSNNDRLGTWHRSSKGMYAAIDGSVTRLTYSYSNGPNTHAWTARTPSGVTTNLTSHSSGYAGWNNR
jgi:competence protein ComGC